MPKRQRIAPMDNWQQLELRCTSPKQRTSCITPLLIVVTGRPGAGKTTLAHTLARSIRCPALCRDEFKEGLVTTVHSSHAVLGTDANRRVYETFFEAVELLLANSITLVIEAAFQHTLWAPKLEPLVEMARIRLVICAIDPTVARARMIQRSVADVERERYHGDWAVQAARAGIEVPISSYEPPRLAVPTLTVDTADGYRPTLDQIVHFALHPAGTAVDGSHP
jgi:predicted kinase